MKNLQLLPAGLKLTITCCCLLSLSHGCKPDTTALKAPEGWELLWNDEFEKESVDTLKWEIQEYESVKGAFKKSNVRIEDNALQFNSIIEDGKRSGGRVMSRDLFGPPLRMEIRFRPVMKPGSFIALWMYPAVMNKELYADQNMKIYKEFDLLECGGGENEVTGDDIKILAYMTMHSWHAPEPSVPGQNKRAQYHITIPISVGNPEKWQEIRFEWDASGLRGDNEIRYYWRSEGNEEWGEPCYVARADSAFFAPDHRMNQIAFGDVKFIDILQAVWKDPMKINLFSHPRAPEGWLSQESLSKQNVNKWGGAEPDPSDYPFDMPVDYVRVFVPEGDARLSK